MDENISNKNIPKNKFLIHNLSKACPFIQYVSSFIRSSEHKRLHNYLGHIKGDKLKNFTSDKLKIFNIIITICTISVCKDFPAQN